MRSDEPGEVAKPFMQTFRNKCNSAGATKTEFQTNHVEIPSFMLAWMTASINQLAMEWTASASVENGEQHKFKSMFIRNAFFGAVVASCGWHGGGRK